MRFRKPVQTALMVAIAASVGLFALAHVASANPSMDCGWLGCGWWTVFFP